MALIKQNVIILDDFAGKKGKGQRPLAYNV